MGIETEFGVTCTFHGHRRLSPDEVARYLFRRVVSWGRSSNVFLRNGARLYLDVGSHPEYATAECDSLVQLVTHDRAGEWVLEDLLVDAEQRLADEGIGGDIYLFKNNTDSAGNSYGCHENYLIVRAGEFSRISDVLLPFLVTRQLICGAGKVLQTPKAATYCLSQRAEHIWEGVSSATTRSRPIINTRDEPHADAEKYRRLHVIVGDSNMSETTTMLKVGTAALVLEMIESGVAFRDFSLDNPIRAIREVSHDVTGRRPVRLAGGRQASALDIQREYYTRAVEHLQTREPNAQIEQVVDLWGRQLDAVESQDFAKVDTEIDWVINASCFSVIRTAMTWSCPTRRSLSWIWPTTTSSADAGSLISCSAKGWPRASPPTKKSRRPSISPHRPPGPGCAVSSSAPRRRRDVISPSTGYISNSTTRRSAPCCAKTRSGRSMSGLSG